MIEAFRLKLIPPTVELMLILKQLKLTVKQCHRKNDAYAKNGGESECIKHFRLLWTALGLLPLNRAFKKENRHFEITKPTHRYVD